MISFLKKRFKSKSNIDPSLFDWKYLEMDDLDLFPNAVDEIYNQQYVGIIIKNVLSLEEIDKIKNGINNIPVDKRIPTGVGFSYPRHFAQLVRPSKGNEINDATLQEYFKECEILSDDLKSKFAVDLHFKLNQIFSKISGGKEVAVAKGNEGDGRFAFGALRVNYSNQGFISVHCGNYFQQEFPQFYTHLEKQVKVKDQLSYFFTIENAEIGGELTLFDALWEDGQSKKNAGDDSGFFLKNGEFSDTSANSKLKRQKIKPNAGDLLIFSGGPIWHKVEKVEGNKDRITFGGFLAFNHSKDKLIYWT